MSDVDHDAAELGRLRVELAAAQVEAARWRRVAEQLDEQVKAAHDPRRMNADRQRRFRRRRSFIAPVND